MTYVLTQRENMDTDTHTRRAPCEHAQRSEWRVYRKRTPRFPWNPQELGEGPGTDSPSCPQKDPTLSMPWSPTRSLQIWNNTFLLFKSLGLWCFVMAALGHYCRWHPSSSNPRVSHEKCHYTSSDQFKEVRSTDSVPYKIPQLKNAGNKYRRLKNTL